MLQLLRAAAAPASAAAAAVAAAAAAAVATAAAVDAPPTAVDGVPQKYETWTYVERAVAMVLHKKHLAFLALP